MEKIITIDGRDVRLNNNIAWAMEYRDQFGKDIIPAIMPAVASIFEGLSTILANTDGEISVQEIAQNLEGRSLDVLLPLFQIELVDVVINITWALAKCANPGIMPPKQWVRQFDNFYLDEVVPAVYELVIKGIVSTKNLERLKNLKIKGLQPSRSMKSFSQELSED